MMNSVKCFVSINSRHIYTSLLSSKEVINDMLQYEDSCTTITGLKAILQLIIVQKLLSRVCFCVV